MPSIASHLSTTCQSPLVFKYQILLHCPSDSKNTPSSNYHMTSVQSKSTAGTSYSTEFIASNDDLLTQILLYLPFKSIARFKSVSKHWLSLISSTPQFVLSKPTLSLLLHHCANPSHLGLLRLHHHETAPHISSFRPLPFFSNGSFRCIQSCNGLLLCSLRIGYKTVYHVYNPTTTHYATLPPLPPQLYASTSQPFVSIAYDPSVSPYYKVVCFRHSSPHTFQLVTYSSETHGWRVYGEYMLLQSYPQNSKEGVFWNGAIHWICRSKSYRLLLEEEEILENPMPPITDNWRRRFKYFGVSWGRLYLINVADLSSGNLNIYQMESDCSCWCLKHQVDIGNDLAASFPEITWRNVNGFRNLPIRFLAQSNVADEEPLLVVQIGNQVVCYNIGSRTFRKIYDLPPHQSGFDNRFLMGTPRTWAFQYIESLSPV